MSLGETMGKIPWKTTAWDIIQKAERLTDSFSDEVDPKERRNAQTSVHIVPGKNPQIKGEYKGHENAVEFGNMKNYSDERAMDVARHEFQHAGQYLGLEDDEIDQVEEAADDAPYTPLIERDAMMAQNNPANSNWWDSTTRGDKERMREHMTTEQLSGTKPDINTETKLRDVNPNDSPAPATTSAPTPKRTVKPITPARSSIAVETQLKSYNKSVLPRRGAFNLISQLENKNTRKTLIDLAMDETKKKSLSKVLNGFIEFMKKPEFGFKISTNDLLINKNDGSYIHLNDKTISPEIHKLLKSMGARIIGSKGDEFYASISLRDLFGYGDNSNKATDILENLGVLYKFPSTTLDSKGNYVPRDERVYSDAFKQKLQELCNQPGVSPLHEIVIPKSTIDMIFDDEEKRQLFDLYNAEAVVSEDDIFYSFPKIAADYNQTAINMRRVKGDPTPSTKTFEQPQEIRKIQFNDIIGNQPVRVVAGASTVNAHTKTMGDYPGAEACKKLYENTIMPNMPSTLPGLMLDVTFANTDSFLANNDWVEAGSLGTHDPKGAISINAESVMKESGPQIAINRIMGLEDDAMTFERLAATIWHEIGHEIERSLGISLKASEDIENEELISKYIDNDKLIQVIRTIRASLDSNNTTHLDMLYYVGRYPGRGSYKSTANKNRVKVEYWATIFESYVMRPQEFKQSPELINIYKMIRDAFGGWESPYVDGGIQ